MSRLQVLMFGWELPPYNSGGLGVATRGLARALSRDADVTLVLPKRLPVVFPEGRLIFADDVLPDAPGMSYFFSPYASGSSRISGGDLPGVISRSLIDEVILFARRARIIAKREKFDIVHAHDWLTFGAGLQAKEVSGKKLLIHIHATEFDRTGGQGGHEGVIALEREGLMRADGIIAVSNYTKGVIISQYDIDPSRIDVVHNGIDDDEVGDGEIPLQAWKARGGKVVLFVGRLTVQKGVDYFLDAARRVLDKIPQTIFVVAGSGDMERLLLKKAVALRIAHRVIFTGFLRGNEVSRLYRSADLFVMPSVSEPFGLTALEAIRHGTPVIVSKQSGVAEVLPHAFKVDFWDVGVMSEQMIHILLYPTLQKAILKSSLEDVLGVTWKKAADKCLALYQRYVG